MIHIFILTGNLGSVHDLIFSIPILRRKSLICPITTKMAYPKYVHIATPSGVCSKCSLNVGVLFVDCNCKIDIIALFHGMQGKGCRLKVLIKILQLPEPG